MAKNKVTPKAKQRQKGGQGGILLTKNLRKQKGEAKDFASKPFGWSRPTYEKAKTVIEYQPMKFELFVSLNKWCFK